MSHTVQWEDDTPGEEFRHVHYGYIPMELPPFAEYQAYIWKCIATILPLSRYQVTNILGNIGNIQPDNPEVQYSMFRCVSSCKCMIPPLTTTIWNRIMGILERYKSHVALQTAASHAMLYLKKIYKRKDFMNVLMDGAILNINRLIEENPDEKEFQGTLSNILHVLITIE